MSDYLEDLNNYTEEYIKNSNESIYEITVDEILESYLEDCEIEDINPELVAEEIEEIIEAMIWEDKNTCDRCGGRGCNYCLMLSY